MIPASRAAFGEHRRKAVLRRNLTQARRIRFLCGVAEGAVQHDDGRAWLCTWRPVDHEHARLPVDDELQRLRMGRGRCRHRGYGEDSEGYDEAAYRTIHRLPQWQQRCQSVHHLAQGEGFCLPFSSSLAGMTRALERMRLISSTVMSPVSRDDFSTATPIRTVMPSERKTSAKPWG